MPFTFDSFKKLREEKGTIVSLYRAHKSLTSNDDLFISGLIQELAEYFGSARKLELATDEDLWSYLYEFEHEFKNQQSVLQELFA